AINANGTSSTVNADGASQVGQISADGRWLVWQTAAKNVRLPGGGKNAPVCATSSSTIYLRNMLTGTVQEVSAPASGGGCGSGAQSASAPVIDGSGATVAFQSTMPLAAGDQNGVSDVFVWQQGGAPLRRISTS